MKSAAVFIGLLSSASAFGIVPPTTMATRTAQNTMMLFGAVAEEEMTENEKEIKRIQEKWHTVRFLSPEEAAAQLEPEWKEAYDRFNEKYDEDMERMQEIAEKLQNMIEPPRVEKKSEGQRRRDKWAKVQAREAARAAKK